MWKPQLENGKIRFRQIVDQIVTDIAAGTLQAGDRLPPQRELATSLNVKLSTVSRAYQEAARQRLVGGEVGRGTYVLKPGLDANLFAAPPAAPPVYDLTTAVPAAPPGDDSLAASLASLTPRDHAQLAGYPQQRLIERTRLAICDWLAWRGMERRPRIIVPCAGAHAALQALLLEKTRPGDPILVESFTFPGIKMVAKQLRLRLVPIEQDGEGVTPEGLDAAAGGSAARIAILVPTLQNPTGAVMGEARRRAVAAVAARHDLTVIEDDVYGPLGALPPLSGELGRRGVIVSSLSQTVLPGLRFGFVAGDDPDLEKLQESLPLTTWLMSPFSMLIGAKWIDSGVAQARVEWQRTEIAARWRQMLALLGPTDQLPAPHAWLRVKGDPDEMVDRCRAAGVGVVPAGMFAVGRKSAARIRICLTAAATRNDLGEALRILAGLGIRA
ncbi:aminotransferase class I/II-fold pyridoxal phosphate-dependent enzyme [Aurantimonas aggregata]|uniref:Aminotransferase class I/II-fold pyridoxal phosphate-dependent enzyme n=1 Tax=Aurantimonas aggregata TaxID=2047720 RepID=A0A6L9MBS1_9HYPH|nr:PLP-dependent aminotransferase family protein [Aurantimonas aggregata]NDV85279.1 aminotransferase class I/II-fold pyridoxal phosphate-dependent enzyme [Aurantimonas aggregata]